MTENVKECLKQVVKAQETLDGLAYVCRGTKEIDVLALKLSIVRAERHLAAAKAVLNEKWNENVETCSDCGMIARINSVMYLDDTSLKYLGDTSLKAEPGGKIGGIERGDE